MHARDLQKRNVGHPPLDDDERASGVRPVALRMPEDDLPGEVAANRPTSSPPRSQVSQKLAKEGQVYQRVFAARPAGPMPDVDEDELARAITRDLLVVLGSLARVPVHVRGKLPAESVPMDQTQAFVLGLVDGQTCIEDMIETSRLPTHQVLLTLTELFVHGLIALRT